MTIRTKFNVILIMVLVLFVGLGFYFLQQSLSRDEQKQLNTSLNAIHAHADELFAYIHNNSDEATTFEAKAFELSDVMASLPNDMFFKFGLAQTNHDRFKLSFWEQKLLNEMAASGLKVSSGFQKDGHGHFYYVARSESLRNGEPFIQVAYQYTQKDKSSSVVIGTVLGLCALVLLLFNVLAHLWVFKPMNLLIDQATAVSKGDGEVHEIDTSDRGELSDLAEAF